MSPLASTAFVTRRVVVDAAAALTLDPRGSIWEASPHASNRPLLVWRCDALRRLWPRAIVAGAVAVDFSNTGTGDALMSGHFSKYVLLDGEGLPRLWGFLTERTTPAGGLISVGGGGSVEGRPSEFGGSATALRAILDFNVAPPGGLVGDATVRPTADGDVDRWSGWNADQAQREARAASF
jgi:hypothetical protein